MWVFGITKDIFLKNKFQKATLSVFQNYNYRHYLIVAIPSSSQCFLKVNDFCISNYETTRVPAKAGEPCLILNEIAIRMRHEKSVFKLDFAQSLSCFHTKVSEKSKHF